MQLPAIAFLSFHAPHQHCKAERHIPLLLPRLIQRQPPIVPFVHKAREHFPVRF